MAQLLKMPITCDYEMSSTNQKSLEIFGKVLPSKGTSFKIALRKTGWFFIFIFKIISTLSRK
jgi:hypothetical protein